MNTRKEEKAVKWEKQRIQRVLKHHNNEYGTHITIKDKAENVYRKLKGQSNWDWVCYDTKTGEEIALEIKKLTDFKLEERGNIIWGILEEIKNDLSNKLPGTFYIDTNIPKDYPLALHQKNKKILKKTLQDTIILITETMAIGDKVDLTAKIENRLPFSLPNGFVFTLLKIDEAGSKLVLVSGALGVWSITLNEDELKEFERHISKANEQLRIAYNKFNAKQTFLVIIDEGHRIAEPCTIADALERINPDSFSHINHIYYVSGEEVAEISLPTP